MCMETYWFHKLVYGSAGDHLRMRQAHAIYIPVGHDINIYSLDNKIK